MPSAPDGPQGVSVRVRRTTADALEELRRELDAPTVEDAVDALIATHRAATPPARAVTGAPRRAEEDR